MQQSLGKRPAVNPPNLADTDLDSDEAAEGGNSSGPDHEDEDEEEPRKKRNKNTGKRKISHATTLLVETMQNGQSAFLKVLQESHKSSIEQSYKMHKEREDGRERSDAKMLEGFALLAGAIKSLRG
jgi:hypothetical protein